MLLNRDEIKRTYRNEVKTNWMKTSNSFPAFLDEVSIETKTQNEIYIQNVFINFQKSLNNFPITSNARAKWKQKMISMLEDVLSEETIIGIHNFMDRQKIDTFQEELKKFLVSVRVFAPTLSIEEIGKAIRNYMVYTMLVEINQIPSEFNKACFGYSMLYPFTDSYIDDQNYSDKEKSEYNKIIREKIEGKIVYPKSVHQEKTCELLSMIEAEYPRERDSTIFTLLLMMLEAQEDSLRQQNKEFPLSYEEILDISLYKGGVSVLIDRFFVKKEITRDDLYFNLAFGFLLQLVDDLQDIKEDSIQGHQTLLTTDIRSTNLELIVNKMFNFVHELMNDYHIKDDLYRNFILSNCYQLIYLSIVGSKAFFPQEYLEMIEKYMPVTCIFLENMQKEQIKNKDIKIQDRYMKILDEMIS